MNKIDISELAENNKEFAELLADLTQKFQCNWNDNVHDSFLLYNQRVCDIYDSFEAAYGSVCRINDTSFNNEELHSSTEHLVNEVEHL